MSRYLDLAKAALEQATQTRRIHDECRWAMHKIMVRLKSFLECPPEAMAYFRVDHNLDFAEDVGLVAEHAPRLTWGADDVLYTGLTLSFQLSPGSFNRVDLHGAIGIEKDSDGFVVTFDRKPIRFSPDDDASMDRFCERFAEHLAEDFKGQIGGPRKPLGFTATARLEAPTAGSQEAASS